ncbi:SDR family oxidoreductase [Ramlibacter sp. 2FC]|uniref:SDR family NAD(P)-dependent oxidoreductase n=1 Tax=Ramlibacter sp. 2FC TaxID=2502188 RepID=UPI0010F8DCFB|nr:SDR family oxidoreductase [Ramlibacter sp. 2FC]
MGRLDGKVAIITGAARGIGAAAARQFAHEGARLMLVDMREGPLRDLATQLGEGVSYRAADVTDEAAIRSMVEETVRLHGKVDVALLNAGIPGENHRLVDCPIELFDKVMAINVRAVWLGLKYLMKAMEAAGGSIVITASTSGVRAIPNLSPYVTSKHAVIGLMRAAALEGASKGIRVNTVNPATIDTPMVQELEAAQAGKGASRDAIYRTIPLGRYGEADEVASMMLFLASDESKFCTGAVYMVDGGATAGRPI